MIGYIYIIYKNGLKEMYIGSTEDLEVRKSRHIESCNNPNHKDYNLKVYQFIRENGGFDSWTFEMIEQYECENKTELRIREQYYLNINKEYLLNRNNSYTSFEERKEQKSKYYKMYYEKNRNKILNDKKTKKLLNKKKDLN